MMIEVDRDLAIVLREAINEVLHTGRFDESDEDKLMELRAQLRNFIAAKEA
jgi:pyruvate/2-oxoglutarate dehydrogenase complex dihydrolipoamide acyltransferase (E2) component